MKKLLLLSLISLSVFAQKNNTEYIFEGQINNKIPIKFNLSFDGNLIEGTLIYTKVGQPIKIVGTLEGDNLLLHEFYSKENVSGGFNATRTKEGFSGIWFSSKPNVNEMNFTVKKTGSREVEKKKPDATGTYSYSFGKNQGVGDIFIQQGSNSLVLSALAVKGAPSYNQAILDKVSFKLNGNTGVYETTEFGKCKLKATFSENSLSIVHLEDAFDCGFGHGISVAGNYIKTSSKPPKFPEF